MYAESYCLKGACSPRLLEQFSLKWLGKEFWRSARGWMGWELGIISLTSIFCSCERVLCFAQNGGEDLEGSFNSRVPRDLLLFFNYSNQGINKINDEINRSINNGYVWIPQSTIPSGLFYQIYNIEQQKHVYTYISYVIHMLQKTYKVLLS